MCFQVNISSVGCWLPVVVYKTVTLSSHILHSEVGAFLKFCLLITQLKGLFVCFYAKCQCVFWILQARGGSMLELMRCGGAKTLKAPPETHVGGCLLVLFCIILLQILKR